jgi:hypothetical protein
VLSFLLLGSACAQERPMQVRCELKIAPRLSATEKAELTFRLLNVGTQPLHLLNWQTPFEGITAPTFTIRRDGVEIAYDGMMVKRGAPAPESYVGLQPGARRQATVDLARGWDVARPGTYTVEYTGKLLDVVAGAARQRRLGDLTPVALRCPPVRFERRSR